MNRSRQKRAALISCGTVLLLLLIPVGLTAVAVYRLRRQERLNHEFIAAVRRNDDKEVVSLLDLGADANCRDEPPLSFSLWQTLMQVVHRTPPPPSRAPTPLLIALEPVHPGINPVHPPENAPLIRVLLEHGARVDQTDGYSEKPLWWAIWYEENTTIRLLLAYGAKPQETGLLCRAAQSNVDVGIIADFLNRGADVNQRLSGVGTALSLATQVESVDVVRLLLARHADPNLPDDSGETPLACALEDDTPASKQIVQLLRAAGARK